MNAHSTNSGVLHLNLHVLDYVLLLSGNHPDARKLLGESHSQALRAFCSTKDSENSASTESETCTLPMLSSARHSPTCPTKTGQGLCYAAVREWLRNFQISLWEQQ